MIAGVVMALFACGIIGWGITTFVTYYSSGPGAIVPRAERHWRAGGDALSAAGDLLRSVDPSARESAWKKYSDASEKLGTARSEYREAAGIIKELPASSGRSEYLASVDAALLLIDGIRSEITVVNGEGPDAVGDADVDAAGASSDIDFAMQDAKARAFDDLAGSAKDALESYDDLLHTLAATPATDRPEAVRLMTRAAELRKQQAQTLVRIAGEESSSKRAAYDADLERARRLGDQAADVPKPTDEQFTPDVDGAIRAAKAQEKQALARAAQLHKKALTDLRRIF